MSRAGTSLRALVGLGNPGDEYARTRHNVGWLLLDEVHRRGRQEERRRLDWVELTRVALRGMRLWTLRPLTWMNRSGLGVSQGCDELGLAAGELLVAYDEVALPLGQLRLRPSGGAGGHNGMQSVIDALGTGSMPRLRMGIRGTEVPRDLTGYVLGGFEADEREAVEEMVGRAADAVETVLRRDLATAMNEYNQRGRGDDDEA